MLPESSVSRWGALVLKRLGLGAALPAGLPIPYHVTERHEHCEEHEIDGHKFWKCRETRARFRLCIDGQRELLETTTSETLAPALAGMALAAPAGPPTHDAVAEPAVLGAHIEHLLDEFVEYAIGLQDKLQAEDAGRTHTPHSSGRAHHRAAAAVAAAAAAGRASAASDASDAAAAAAAAAAADAASPAEAQQSLWAWV